MLAETLQEWEEQKLNEGRQEGRLAGRTEGREEERERIRRLADRHLDAATASAFTRLINADDELESPLLAPPSRVRQARRWRSQASPTQHRWPIVDLASLGASHTQWDERGD